MNMCKWESGVIIDAQIEPINKKDKRVKIMKGVHVFGTVVSFGVVLTIKSEHGKVYNFEFRLSRGIRTNSYSLPTILKRKEGNWDKTGDWDIYQILIMCGVTKFSELNGTPVRIGTLTNNNKTELFIRATGFDKVYKPYRWSIILYGDDNDAKTSDIDMSKGSVTDKIKFDKYEDASHNIVRWLTNNSMDIIKVSMNKDGDEYVVELVYKIAHSKVTCEMKK